MERPEDYEKHLKVSEITNILDEFEEEISLMKGKCIDIGCGPGDVSKQLILPKLPPDVILEGVDISQKMVDYAQKKYSDGKRMLFKKMNIESTDFPEEVNESYDNSISFFCLQWIHDLRSCYNNIYKILRPGGNFFLHAIVSEYPHFAYRALAENPKYKPYMGDITKVISPLHFDKTPIKTVKEIVRNAGFKVLHCSLRENSRVYNNEEELMNLLIGINPFIDRMPKKMHKEFMTDVMHEVKKQALVCIEETENGEKEEKIVIKYIFMVGHFKK